LEDYALTRRRSEASSNLLFWTEALQLDISVVRDFFNSKAGPLPHILQCFGPDIKNITMQFDQLSQETVDIINDM
jgi:hypothetical protein